MTDYISIHLVGSDLPPASFSLEFLPLVEPAAPGQPGKSVGEVFIHSANGGQKILVSLGDPKKLKTDTFRQAGGAAAKWMIQNQIAAVDLASDNLDRIEIPGAVSALIEGLFLGGFQFLSYKTPEEKTSKTPIVQIRTTNPSEYEKILLHAQTLCEYVNLERTWGHEPANIINPITLAERVAALAVELGLACTILDEKELEKMGAGGIVNVGKGSNTPSRMIILEYPGKPGSDQEKPVVLVGKAITFDTGGYSLKGVDNIVGMKYDKCGGITVAATLAAAAKLGLRRPIIGIIAASENMISGGAYRPDDIIRMLSGKTVEIISTDAEGRLVLADALALAQQKYSPRAIIDLATLTGGVLVALGRIRAAIMGNNQELIQNLIQSGEATQELLWQLPMDDDYAKSIKGDDADIKNSGGREGHAILGGMFLKQFVSDDIPWVHLDIAAVADTPKDLPYCPKGATGFGIRLLIHYLENL